MCGDEAGLEFKRAEWRARTSVGDGDGGGDSFGDRGDDERSGSPGGVHGDISLDLDEAMLVKSKAISVS